MDDYTREMMDLKTLVTRTLEKKGVLAKIRPKDSWKSELRDFNSNNGFELNRNGDSGPLLLDVLEGFLKFESMTQGMGSSSRRDSETESSSSLESRNPPRRSSASDSLPPQRRKDEFNWRQGNQDTHEEVTRASAALENLQLDRKTRNLTSSWRTMDDYTREMMDLKTLVTRTLEKKGVLAKIRAKDSWKSEIRDFSINNGYELNRNEDSRPLLLDVLEGFLKFENMTQVMGGSSRRESETESSLSLDTRNPPRRSSASDSLPHQRRSVSASQASGAATSGYRKDESNWRYDTEDMPEEVMRASTALENLQLDRKTRNLTSSWRNVKDGTSEEEEGKD
nr:hypothetical protein [Arabidopsis thaliana]